MQIGIAPATQHAPAGAHDEAALRRHRKENVTGTVSVIVLPGNSDGIGGSGSARRTIATASASRDCEPELRTRRVESTCPLRSMVKATAAVPCSSSACAASG